MAPAIRPKMAQPMIEPMILLLIHSNGTEHLAKHVRLLWCRPGTTLILRLSGSR